ncbi:MAG: DEAD/DEAH box helicase [Bacteroidales bacterium]|nr:DEAD/DEAH box helicase [Bacteroidales bacterium]
MNKEYIDRYIKFNAVERVIDRADNIIKDDKISLDSIDYARDTAEFIARGTQKYHLKIQGFIRKNITTSCSCPYDWNVLCKHRVAALKIIADIDEPSEKEIKIINQHPRINANTPILVPNYKKLIKTLILELAPEVRRKLAYIDVKIVEIKDIKKNSLTLICKKEYFSNKEAVYFKKTNKELYVSSENNNASLNGYSYLEASCLLRLIEMEQEGFFHYMLDGEFEEVKKDLKKSYKLSKKDDFDEYFMASFDDNKIKLHLYNKGLGLLSAHRQNQYINKIKALSQTVNQINFNVKKEVREIGFLLVHNDKYSKELGLRVLKGKMNKKGDDFASHINTLDELKDNEITYPTDQQKQLISLIDEYNNLYINIEDYENRSEEYLSKKINPEIELQQNQHEETKVRNLVNLRDTLSLIQQIFSLLAKEKYIFQLPFFSDYERFKKKDLMPVQISQNACKLVLKTKQEEQFLNLESFIQIDNELFALSDSDDIDTNFFTCAIEDKIYVLDNINSCLYINNYHYPLKIHQDEKSYFFKEIIAPLSQQFTILFDKNVGVKDEHYPNAEFRQLYISEEGENMVFNPVVTYSNGASYPLSQYGNKLDISDDKITEFKRDREFEDDFLNLLGDLHPEFEQQKYSRIFHLPFDELMRKMWFYGLYEQLEKEGVEIYGINELKKFKYSPFQAKVSTNLKSGEDWFELDVQVVFGNYQIKIADLKKAIVNKQQFIQLKNGTVGILPEEWLEKFQKYFRNAEVKDNKLLISKLRFSVIDELYENIDNTEILKEISEKKRLLQEINDIEKASVPKDIKADLRDYQKEGLQWLHFLDSLKWGGILADDMGLGKTLQILAFLKLKLQESDNPALIVVPTSLLFNWENEIAKFTPSLKAHYHYGLYRERNTDKFNDFHIIFTSYGVLVRDIEILKDYKFKYVVLDESQSIKNPMSQRYKAANLLKAKNKFALTGTPIENSTFDLFAQMNFVNPGFFGNIKSFKEDYSNRIDKDANVEISKELQKLSNPFILRRTKDQVATELPPKTENILYCEMESEQRQVYEAYRNDYRDKILKKIDDDGMGKSKMYILEGLLRLRQICDSPALLKGSSSQQSVKIKELLGFITEKTSQHKLLIFSQFVGMLGLIRQELDQHHIDYEYLDGKSTKNQRQESVENFQTNENIRVFLVSLKAGGTGLNLTAADYVFLVDPWWNPAVEEQAIDRCYRIGQDKKVFAYRMICKDTVEEKILKLQNKKKKIASDIIQTDENIMKTITSDDIRDLFS